MSATRPMAWSARCRASPSWSPASSPACRSVCSAWVGRWSSRSRSPGSSLAHLLVIPIPGGAAAPEEGEKRPTFDIAGAMTAIRAVPGLLALILFATFNNLVGGVFMALMDPYGPELFDVKVRGVVLGVTSPASSSAVGSWLFGLGHGLCAPLLLVKRRWLWSGCSSRSVRRSGSMSPASLVFMASRRRPRRPSRPLLQKGRRSGPRDASSASSSRSRWARPRCRPSSSARSRSTG